MLAFVLRLALGGFNLLKLLISAAKRFFAALNVQGWIGLAVSVAIGLGWLSAAGDARHFRKSSTRFEQLYNGEIARRERIAKQALELKAKFDALTAQLTATLKEKHDEELGRIAAHADALRLRGPGRSACLGGATVAGGAGQYGAAATVADVARPRLPADDGTALRAAVPWPWLVGRAAEHDALLDEVKAWREQHRQLEQIWPKSAGAGK